MLRAIAGIYLESQALTRRDGFKVFRGICNYSSVTASDKTVVSAGGEQSAAASPPAPAPAPPPPPPPPPRAPRAAAWSAAAALAVSASLGGIYFYRKLSNEDKEDEASQMTVTEGEAADEAAGEAAGEWAAVPARAEQLPAHAEFLLVGGGTAAFAAMRAIRSARPDAHVLIASAEPALPYMRPPLSKELWREPDPAAADSFRQWNGRRRSLAYEPEAFYTPPERMRDAPPGAALARGWRVVELDVDARAAVLQAGEQRHRLTYGRALLATGARARRVPALRAAAAAGRSLALRDARDAARLARALDAPGVRSVAVLGGGFLASELSAALAARLAAEGAGRRVLQLFREEAPLARVLPPYLAADAARRLAAAGVRLVARAELAGAAPEAGGVRLRLAGGAQLAADLVVECAGAEPRAELAARAGLELHGALGGVLVNGELAARSGVWAAGDVACFYDEALGRRRVEHHDHAVVSGRLAGDNMAGADPPRVYRHQSMFWSDLGPQLGYEAIGIIDSRLPTVGVFSADAVAAERTLAAAEGAEPGARTAAATGAPTDAATGEPTDAAPGAPTATVTGVPTDAAPGAPTDAAPGAPTDAAPSRFERGVVFYLREGRVVGVLLWNLFNRMHVARQVLAQGHFDDLLEAAKLFAPHDEE